MKSNIDSLAIRIEALWHTTSQFYTNMTVEVRHKLHDDDNARGTFCSVSLKSNLAQAENLVFDLGVSYLLNVGLLTSDVCVCVFAVQNFILFHLCVLLWLKTAVIVLQFLPVYNPSQEEKNDPNLYADNVQKLMAK